MKTLLLAVALVFAAHPSASAWAILMNSPSLQYTAPQPPEAIKSVEEAMAKLDFEGGVIHVSAPVPTRSMRFQAPGHKVTELLPLLENLGFTVTVSFSNTLPENQGFAITQPEDGSKTLEIVLNAKHPKFDLEKLKIRLGSAPPKP